MATAAAPTYFRRHRTAEDIGLTDGGTWCNNPIALAVVEAITLLGWPRSSLHVLSLGCGEEVYMFGEAPGWGSLAADLSRLFMDGQSHGAIGMAKLLTGHDYEREAIFRYWPLVPKNFFVLGRHPKDHLLGHGRGVGPQGTARGWSRSFFRPRLNHSTPIYKLKALNHEQDVLHDRILLRRPRSIDPRQDVPSLKSLRSSSKPRGRVTRRWPNGSERRTNAVELRSTYMLTARRPRHAGPPASR